MKREDDMTNCLPPYRPLRGAEPPHFVDRPSGHDPFAAGIVAQSTGAFAAGPCDPRFHAVVTGAPALGKTAVLRAIAKEASLRLGWAASVHRCRPKERVPGRVADEVGAAVRQAWPEHLRQFADEVVLPSGRGLPGPAAPWGSAFGEEVPWAALRRFLQLAGTFAQAISRGLVLAFDDADRLARGELEALGHLARGLSREGSPVAFVFAGGPELEAVLARAGGHCPCTWPVTLPWFCDEEAREALVVPATERGVEFEEGALEALCEAAGGSPLEVQRLGFVAWTAARGGDVVTLEAAEGAVAASLAQASARAS